MSRGAALGLWAGPVASKRTPRGGQNQCVPGVTGQVQGENWAQKARRPGRGSIYKGCLQEEEEKALNALIDSSSLYHIILVSSNHFH